MQMIHQLNFSIHNKGNVNMHLKFTKILKFGKGNANMRLKFTKIQNFGVFLLPEENRSRVEIWVK